MANEEGFRPYRRKAITEMRPYVKGENLTGVAVHDEARKAGSPKVGDYIARQPYDHQDVWLVTAEVFAKSGFEEVQG